ncbi:hypothetical protein [Methanoregula sp.]|uniref:hypothetical protein n=1 Tax=Methanoregula sp. TaxID=2052170 RepID=UPI0025E04E1E|nr:hypothetical protein [Methanoregula sp.]
MTGSLQTPFARLVLFMIFLSVAGSVVAGVYYFAAVQPDQKTDHTPINRVCDYNKCIMWAKELEKTNGGRFCVTCPNVYTSLEFACERDPCAYLIAYEND